MKYRMGTALLSLAGIFVSAYLWMFKHGYIGSLACGTGGCATVQFSEYSRFLGVDVALLGCDDRCEFVFSWSDPVADKGPGAGAQSK